MRLRFFRFLGRGLSGTPSVPGRFFLGGGGARRRPPPPPHRSHKSHRPRRLSDPAEDPYAGWLRSAATRRPPLPEAVCRVCPAGPPAPLGCGGARPSSPPRGRGSSCPRRRGRGNRHRSGSPGPPRRSRRHSRHTHPGDRPTGHGDSPPAWRPAPRRCGSRRPAGPPGRPAPACGGGSALPSPAGAALPRKKIGPSLLPPLQILQRGQGVPVDRHPPLLQFFNAHLQAQDHGLVQVLPDQAAQLLHAVKVAGRLHVVG